MISAYLAAPRYVLGEIEQNHNDIPDFTARARAYGMQADARLWGWGKVRRTERSLEELIIESGLATMAAARADAASVDLLLLCSTRFPGDAQTHGAFMETIMKGLGLDCAFIGLTLNRCTNLVSGLGAAEAFVRSGRYSRVLVATADRVAEESARMENFALFSDGAASCLVTATAGGFEILGSATAQDTRRLDWGNEISSDLSRQVNDLLLAKRGLAPGDIAGLLHPNLYTPIVVMKELQAGFTTAQLDTHNTARVGHCFAADPLINLTDRPTEPGAYYLLAASVPGSRVAMLLRRTTG